MFHLSNLVNKAQNLVDANILPIVSGAEKRPSKSGLFRQQFHLPDSQNPLHEITAELILPKKTSTTAAAKGKAQKRASWDKDNWDKDKDQAAHYVGRLHISERFLCFSTINTSFLQTASTSSSSTFHGHTHGAGPAAYGFTLPLCAVRRVERLHSQTVMFALSISTWNGYPSANDAKAAANPTGKTVPESPKLKIQLSGSRQQCERFCDGLEKGLRDGMKEVESMRKVIGECYSEFLLDLEDRRRREKANDKPKDLLSDDPIKSFLDLQPPDTGLGTIFRYPGDPKKLRDKGKMRLWYEYMRENGRNVTLVRQPDLARLIRIGLPNRLRGEVWDLMSGALFNRLENPRCYQETLEKFDGRTSIAIDEIEKDLNRSLPEYPGFQSEEGIGRLRRVLTAYSWTNPEVGYCQAMNIVVAAMLIYLSETQAFYVLSVLCDRLLPGYYSTTMYGTLLDQRVFESLVERTLPILSEHLTKTDIQLSVVSLPWFLSLYINSIPLVFAFRVLDVFFLEGPKVLFQIGLAILRINGEELLDASDDGGFISVLKNYFARLGESAHPKSENPKLRAVTNFQALMVVAFREFAGITLGLITEQRAKHKDAVLNNIESFAKRTSIRNLSQDCKKLSQTDLGFIYDRFYGVLYERQQRMEMIQQETERRQKSAKAKAAGGAPEIGRVGLGPSPTQMDFDAFREFLAGISKWAITDSPSSPMKELNTTNGKQNGYFSSMRGRSVSTSAWGNGPEPADHDFMRRLYASWRDSDRSATDGPGGDRNGELTLQDVAAGMARLKGNQDIMAHIQYFFDLYDDDGDGKVDREGILRISEGLLFLSRRGLFSNVGVEERLAEATVDGAKARRESKDEQFLGAVSAFIRRCFEYADPSINPDVEGAKSPLSASDTDGRDDTERRASAAKHASANVALDPNNPLHLTLPTFRMLVLADEALESFFDSGFPNSFNLADAPLPSSTLTTTSTGLTTFQTAAMGDGANKLALPTMGAAAGIVAPGKGIRGMLDNIVTDGMRVAADVKRRMDEAQRELDKSAAPRGDQHDEDDDEDDDEGGQGAKDLLEEMDASAGVSGPQSTATLKPGEASLLDASPVEPVTATPAGGEEVKSSTVFER